MPAPHKDLPHAFKLLTLWLVIGVALFLAFTAWEHRRTERRFQMAGDTIVLTRGDGGHFHWPGRVNGMAVDFLVDTGATATALPQALAERLGLKPLGPVQSNTAAGLVRGYAAKANLALDGGVAARSLTVVVLPSLDAPLLGMDVLGRLHFRQRPGELRIEPDPETSRDR